MELYKKYQKEKYGREVIESADGFITYAIYPDGSCYIDTLFVSKESRNKGEGKRLEDLLIKKERPSVIYCDIDLLSNNPEKALCQIVTKAGYKIDQVYSDRIVLRKEVCQVKKD